MMNPVLEMMAPSPEYDKEPIAPDKSATHISSEETDHLHSLVSDQPNSSDHTTTNSATNTVVKKVKHVDNLDDEKLRALLDEAITYKCPKDREGKSRLFKELLKEAELDEKAKAARNRNGSRSSRRRARGRRAMPHSNSLQNLVATLPPEPAPKHKRRRHQAPVPSNVSAHAVDEGSLPSGVDTSSLPSEDGSSGGSGAGYLATVRCVNPPPLTEHHVSASDANAPQDLELLNRRSKSTFPMTYTARATLEIGSGSVCSGRAVTTTTASNQVDSAIPFSCITTPEVVTNCSTTSSSSTAAVAIEPLQLGSDYHGVASITGSPPSTSTSPPVARPSSSVQDAPELQRSFDENDNAVQSLCSPFLGSSQYKKPRRKKSSKNETVINCQQLDGYRGDKADVNELLRFIESNPETRGPKMRVKHKDDTDDKATKKRSTDRRKDKEKVKRASSLEELSRTKLEDLTARAAPTPKPERRSWGDPTPSTPAPEPTPSPDPDSEPNEPATPPTETEPEIDEPIEIPTTFELPMLPLPEPFIEQTDFQTVTKKRKPRRRTEEAHRRTRQPSPRRQESAPASDRSNDSNDDMDSVHSLHQPGATIPPPIPHASYADIARTRSNIPDLIESCNYYTEDHVIQRVELPAPTGTDGYPALETRIPEPPPPALPRRRELKQPPPLRRDRKERMVQAGPPPATEFPAPDVVADRRPPVILLDSNSRPRDMDGVTFGFDINEQLLGGALLARCDLVRACSPAAAHGLPVRAACRPLRYLPPAPPRDPRHLHQIIAYVAAAWEDAVRCGGGKVPYFSE